MNFFRINNTDKLQIGSYNILEPQNGTVYQDSTNSIILVPGIAFSTQGARIGFGKGFYDKFYQTHHVYKLGITYKECIIDEDFNDKFDVPLDDIIYC